MKRLSKLLLFTIILLACSCQNVLQRPSEGVAKYMLPEYRDYIQKDATLTDREKIRRYNAINAYIKLVRDNTP